MNEPPRSPAAEQGRTGVHDQRAEGRAAFATFALS